MALFMPKNTDRILKIKSFGGRDKWYNVNLSQKTCSCLSFQKSTGWKTGCKHLHSLGVYVSKTFNHTATPTFSQALCGLVKSIRIRNVEEAVYWLYYLHSFPDNAQHFRTARRILIGSSEDGHSVAVMEKCASSMFFLAKKETQLLYLVAEVVRICKIPNWWHPYSGGPDYIYQSLLGVRKWVTKSWSKKLEELITVIEKAIDDGDKATAIGAVSSFDSLKEKFSNTQQAEFLLEIAEKRNHEMAKRLCQIHLKLKTALSSDNNFLSQAVWMLAGGVSPVADQIEPVIAGECQELIDKAIESWKTPHIIPGWCCDGIHCAGGDTRFMGTLPEMYAVCNAFKHYGRIDPNDKWLPEFICYDGLEIEQVQSIA